MSPRASLWIVLVIGLGGLTFSGYLSYHELFAPTLDAPMCAPVGVPGTMFGYPPCVYGFFMYLAIVLISALGLRRPRNTSSSESLV